jgi:hypothetical protein
MRPCVRRGSIILKTVGATYAQRDYAITNPMGWDGYSKKIWGLSASNGPGDVTVDFKGTPTRFHGYAAYGPKGMPDEDDRGTLAPVAAVASRLIMTILATIKGRSSA